MALVAAGLGAGGAEGGEENRWEGAFVEEGGEFSGPLG